MRRRGRVQRSGGDSATDDRHKVYAPSEGIERDESE